MAYETVTSADGTPIAYESFGRGAPLIAVCGATCDRALMRSTAQTLGELHAVAAGLPVEKFVLHDPPYSPDDESSKAEARSFAQGLRTLLAEDKHAEAIETFYRGTGMPDEVIKGMRETPMWPGLIALAPTLAYDSAVMRDIDNGGAIPEDLAAQATRPGLVLVGGESPPFMIDLSRRLANLLPEGSHRVIDGQDHVVAPHVLAPIVAEFLRT